MRLLIPSGGITLAAVSSNKTFGTTAWATPVGKPLLVSDLCAATAHVLRKTMVGLIRVQALATENL